MKARECADYKNINVTGEIKYIESTRLVTGHFTDNGIKMRMQVPKKSVS